MHSLYLTTSARYYPERIPVRGLPWKSLGGLGSRFSWCLVCTVPSASHFATRLPNKTRPQLKIESQSPINDPAGRWRTARRQPARHAAREGNDVPPCAAFPPPCAFQMARPRNLFYTSVDDPLVGPLSFSFFSAQPNAAL